MLTVKKFLELPAFHDLKIVSGSGGLDNVISAVNIMDNPDALDWFSPGELLLTSGYFFQNDSEMQNYIVRQLKDMNCPGLCIKPKRYLKNIPQNMIFLSEELNLPIIYLPYGMSFSQISKIVNEELSENYDIQTKRALDIHRTFFDISLKERGLSKITQTLVSMISNPVILMDQAFNVLDFCDVDENSCQLREYLQQNFILDITYVNSLPPSFEQLQKPLSRKLNLGNHMIDTIIIPIYVHNRHYGYILVWQTVKALSDMDYIALEFSTLFFALEQIRNSEIEKIKTRIKGDFLEDLVSGNITDMKNLKYFCDIYGMNPELYYVPIVLFIRFPFKKGADLVEEKQYKEAVLFKILYFLEYWEKNKPFALYFFSSHDQIYILLGFKKPEKGDIQEIRNICLEIISDIEEKIKDISVYAGIGRMAKGLMGIHSYFRQASEALRLAKNAGFSKKLNFFDDFAVHSFLEANVSDIEMRRFFENTLGELYRYDKETESALVPTLASWLDNNLNVAQTARALFIHRNTLLYRIDKISAILNTDLKDSNELLKYQLALKIYQMLELQP